MTTTTAQAAAKPQCAQVSSFERVLCNAPALVERILAELPAVPTAPERVVIKADVVSVDSAICKALALAVLGIEARLELTTQ